MERCPKCDGILLQMKIKKTLMPDAEKKQGWKCSRCGYYQEKQQVFISNHRSSEDLPFDPYRLPNRDS